MKNHFIAKEFGSSHGHLKNFFNNLTLSILRRMHTFSAGWKQYQHDPCKWFKIIHYHLLHSLKKNYLILSSNFQHIILNNKSPIKLFFEIAIIAICPFSKNDIFFLLRFKITAQILQFANTKVLWSRCAEIVHVSVWMDFKEETVQSSTQVVVKFQNSSYFNSQGLNIF